jgi:hypothetical protein
VDASFPESQGSAEKEEGEFGGLPGGDPGSTARKAPAGPKKAKSLAAGEIFSGVTGIVWSTINELVMI